ncbi:hypothetical protein [Bacillus thuringiensis]|uniref:hypothetical protein n=1 Tax=Bacillus thuringiensis TaxID=1428 RepID=UPI0021D65652|nr:hypothetical protein [Bacillus thuringiensis]MCU7668029.1 hypothetical protein [Bacillus thuringiensis]
MLEVQINQAAADKIEELRKLPYYANQEDTDGAIIENHADKNSSWGKGHPLEEMSVGKLARALLIGYKVVNY